jgi:hypothetical protein
MVHGSHLSSLSTLQKVSSHEGDYNLYQMTIEYDYDLDAIIGQGVGDDQAYLDAVASQVLPGVPVDIEAPSFGCSAFRAVASDSTVLMGRNYDFKQDTSALMVRTAPKDGYASLAFACLNNLGANRPDEDAEGKAACLLAPFACLDGVNEKGVSIAVLTLDSEPASQDTGRPRINTSLAIRLVLDRASTVQEAVGLLAAYDMQAMAGRDYHFFVSDALNDSLVIEYDPRSPARTMTATSAREITNYYALYADEVLPHQRNGALGHGRERADAIADVLDGNRGRVSVDVAWEALRASAQDPDPHDITSNTQWSVVYDNTNLTAQFVLRRHWDEVFSFSLDGRS